MNSIRQWPGDADGDVFRRMESHGFDFSASHDIDFNVDFDSWPPPAQFLEQLRATYPEAELVQPDDESAGYVAFVINSRVSYELVTFVQRTVSELAAPFGGVCESWGVLH